MENKDYTTYKAIDFASDAFFFCWVFTPTPEANAYWKEIQNTCPALIPEIDRAIKILKSTTILTSSLPKERKLDIKKQIDLRIAAHKQRKFYLWTALRVASCLALIVMLSVYFFVNSPDTLNYSEIVQTPAEIFSGNQVVLVLNDSNKMELNKGASIKYEKEKVVIAQTDDSLLTTSSQSIIQNIKETLFKEDEKTTLNKLIVPNGRTSFITFSDGTNVWVNSGTVLVYPVAFNGDKREIYVEGEIYLEVSPDKTKPFIVKTADCDVKVVGTSFNVSSYKDDAGSSVVLVEGSVQVDTKEKNESLSLFPGERMSFLNGALHKEDVNTELYICWKNGLLLFRNESIPAIMKRISRYYNVEVIYHVDVSNITCSGKLIFNNGLNHVIETIESTAPVKIEHRNGKLEISMNP